MKRRLNERINKMEQNIISMPDMVKQVVREEMVTLEETIQSTHFNTLFFLLDVVG